MHVPPHYQEDRPDILLGAIRERAFGTLITAGRGGITTSHVPFAVAEAAGRAMLLTHLSRANPQWREAPCAGTASFLLHDAYVSPGWYPSKAATGRVVPTWNYVAVEARGRLGIVADGPELLALMRALTEGHEAGRPEPWSIEDAPGDFTASLMRGIVGLKLEVTALTGAWKLDQKKPSTDREGAAQGLRQAGFDAIADLMTPGAR